MKSLTLFYSRMIHFLNSMKWFPLLLARLTVGLVFVNSGWGKLHNLPKVIEFFQSLGIPGAEYQAPFVAGMELVGGILLLLGLGTRLVSIPLAFIMVIAIATAKQGDITEWMDILGFSECLYIILLLVLLFQGAGMASLDRFFCHNTE